MSMEGHIDITAPKVIPDVTRLVDTVCEHSRLHASYVYGDQHWRAVAEVGLRLLPETRRADGMVIFLFSLFHDSMRQNEAADPDHGRRGAQLARALHGRLYRLSEDRLEWLVKACTEHTGTPFSDDPTLGVCFDSDRLNLWRVGKVPEAKFLSTDAALEDDLHQWSRNLHGHARDWGELLQAYSG